jgi:molybdenum cofactor synthesis domain-containing protein
VNTAAVLTISDSAFNGTRKDTSGPATVQELVAAGFQVIITAILPDEKDQIQQKLLDCSRQVRLVVTVGGTGIAVRDVTPEATLAIADRLIVGIPERMRAIGMTRTPLAALSRGLCAVRGKSLIVNLPGSPKAAVESLNAVIELLPHALELLSGNTEHQVTGHR